MSSGGMPELGSKISLISKADIRYEGRLFTVDPQECTIALANVRSFGTEERETSYPILPQPTVYDYILFRGSDIKDIRVVNAVPIPNDPAIMQMHLPQQQGFPQQGFQPMQAGGAPPMNNFGPFGQIQAGMAMGGPNMPQQQAQSPVQSHHPGNNNNLAPGSGSGQKNKKPSELSNEKTSEKPSEKSSKPTALRKQSNKSQDSRSGTPQNARKSPTSDMGVQTRENRENQSGSGNKERNQRNNQQRNNNQQQQQRERRDSGRNEVQENKGGYRNQTQRPANNNQQQQPQQQQRGGYNNRNNQGPGQNQPQGGQQMRRTNQGGSARMGSGPPMNNYRQHNNQGTPNQNQNQNKQSNGPQQQQPRNNRPSHALKFENEFDFEQANVKFEELRTQLQRLKVGSEEVKPDQVNGEVEKKDDSGNETGADQEVEHDDQGYDKNKSFFDNISCEAVERSKGKTPRTDWRQERKINSETFGYSFNRRGMNYRGQGRNYQNRYPRQNYNRGPHQQNNYRPVRNHRNQNNAGERSNAPNPGQQSQNQAAPIAAN